MIVGVIGTGTMGRGIVLAFAQAEGYEVCLCSRKEESARSGKEKIARSLEKRVSKGKITKEKAEEILGKIKTGTNEICAQADLVIESVREDMETKKKSVQGIGKDLSRRLHIRNKHLRFVNYGDGTGAEPSDYRHALF